jgi:hypothetical protein
MPCRVRVVEGGDAFLRSHQEIAYSFLKLVAQRLYGLTNFVGDVRPTAGPVVVTLEKRFLMGLGSAQTSAHHL